MSTNRAGLVQAILEQPDDDDLRLIFADYLEDHDEPDFARFIRTQVALAGVPEYDPLYLRVWFRDRDSVTGRGMQAHRPPLPAGFQFSSNCFERGFPAKIDVRDNTEAAFASFASVGEELFRIAPIQTVEFRSDYRAAPPSLASLTDSPHLTRLRRLRFKLGRIGPTEIHRLQDSPHAANLTGLEFEFAGIDPAAVWSLFRPQLISRLTHLKLHSNNLPWRAADEAIRNAEGPFRLRRLELSETTRTGTNTYGFFDAPLLDTVTELDFRGYELGAAGFEALARSRVAGHVASLELVKTVPGVPGLQILAESPALRQLRRLNLTDNRIGPVGVRHLTESPHLVGLHSLNLNHNPIKDTGLARILAAPFFANLVNLELQDCGITEVGLRMLLEAPVPPGLVHLNAMGDFSNRQKIDERLRQQVRDRFGPGTKV